MAMTQRGQMLCEEELHAAGDIFDDPDACSSAAAR